MSLKKSLPPKNDGGDGHDSGRKDRNLREQERRQNARTHARAGMMIPHHRQQECVFPEVG